MRKKIIPIVLISACLLSTLVVTRSIETVQANPELPWAGQITLHAAVTTNPWWGYFGGYHDIWYSIKNELAKIGINLVIDYYDDYTLWDQVWDEGWNHAGGTPYPPGGWDLTMLEWWMMPTGLIWMEPLFYSWMTPPAGRNVFPYMNAESDELLWKGMRTLDATERKYYLWKWQEQLMHDPPLINLYYPRLYEVTGAWIEGWDPVVRFRDVSHLAINVTAMPPERRTLLIDRIYYAVHEEMWSLDPLLIRTLTEQWMCDLQFETLYDLSIDPWPPTGQETPPRDFYLKPVLAADYPRYLRKTPEDAVGTRVRVPLRQGVKWSDFDQTGEYLDAQDVKYTFDLILDPTNKAVAHGDIAHVIESVEIVNKTCVDFILYEPYADFTTLLSNDRGPAILPYHRYRRAPLIPFDPWEFDQFKWLPVTGPFKPKELIVGEHVILERNPLYFGFDKNVVGTPVWGPDTSVQSIYLKWVPDALVRTLELKNYRLDLGDYLTAPIELLKEIEKAPHLRVWQYNSPSNNPILLNLNNPNLSNRYMRLAIAHTIPYETIFAENLLSWGIKTTYPGKTLITPLHYYTDTNNVTAHLFNENLEPFHYDLKKALDYMHMWWYSTDPDYTKGPVGDADYSGRVDLDDFAIWRASIGDFPHPVELCPGNIRDPDFDNNNIVNIDDFWLWRENYGKQYPFTSAR